MKRQCKGAARGGGKQTSVQFVCRWVYSLLKIKRGKERVSRLRASAECMAALKSHAKTPLCHKPGCPVVVKAMAQGTGPDRWPPYLPYRATSHSLCSRCRRAGLLGGYKNTPPAAY